MDPMAENSNTDSLKVSNSGPGTLSVQNTVQQILTVRFKVGSPAEKMYNVIKISKIPVFVLTTL